MCGIFAYLNYFTPCQRQKVLDILINGLKRLEYRGYDSSGVCVSSGKSVDRLDIYRKPGKVQALADHVAASDVGGDKCYPSHVGMAHTRWATHGEPTDYNAHPQRSDADNSFVVIHNGILTNFKDIKKTLMSHKMEFESETDTEVIAKLLKYVYDTYEEDKKPMFSELAHEIVSHLDGAFALIIMSKYYPTECVACKRGSPMILGIRTSASLEDSGGTSAHNSQLQSLEAFGVDEPMNTPIEYFIASDASALIEHTNRVVYIEDDDMLVFQEGRVHVSRVDEPIGQKNVPREIHKLELELEQIMKGNFPHYMLKEIFEQPESVVNSMRGRLKFDSEHVVLGGLSDYLPSIRRCRRLVFVACGTSYHSAVATRLLFENLSDLPVSCNLASDFLDREAPVFRDDVCVFISQSGETADTLKVLELCKKRGSLCVGITNTVGSAIARMTDCGVHINAGAEIGVASTKAYTSQIISLILFAIVLADDYKSKSARISEIVKGLKNISEVVSETLRDVDENMKALSKKMLAKGTRSLLILGRGYQFATCLEGALKIKELSYLHSEGILLGELKHGPLALVDEHMPIIIIATQDRFYDKVKIAVEQVSARGGNPIIMCTNPKDFENFEKIVVPKTEEVLQMILNVVPLQLLSYYLAVEQGYNVDQPRNLAKSVTVE